MNPETTKLEKSEAIDAIAAALAKFQAAVAAVKKDGNNPFFKSKYATLENIIETVREPLSKQGLSFSQFPNGENGLTTILLHLSGQYLMATYTMKPKDNTPQGIGSAITYMRRYALSAVLGIATEEDDDGNAASQAKSERVTPYKVERKVPAADDEAGGSVIQTDPTVDEKKHIVATLKKLGKATKTKKLCEEAVKELTELDLTPENYPTIITRLEAVESERQGQ